MARACCSPEVLFANERYEVREMAQIHPSMIDHVYRSVGPFTLTLSVATAILWRLDEPRQPGGQLKSVATVTAEGEAYAQVKGPPHDSTRP